MTTVQLDEGDIPPSAAGPMPSMRTLGRQLRDAAPVAVVGLVMVLFFVYPLVNLAVGAVTDKGATTTLRTVFTEPGVTKMLMDTAKVILAASLCATVVAVLFAWLNERTTARLGFVASVLPLTPLLVPPLAATVGWIFMASDRAGVLNVLIRNGFEQIGVHLESGPFAISSFYGLVFLYTLNMVPFIYLPLAAAFANLDPSLEEASRVSGRGPLYTLLHITLPAVRPALAAGMLLGIVMGIATFSIPLIVGAGHIEVLAVRIYNLLTFGYPPRTTEAVALSLIVVTTVLTLSILQRWFTSKGGQAVISGKGARRGYVDLGPAKWIARSFMILFLLASSVVPLLGLIYVSLLGRWDSTLRFSGLNFDSYRVAFFDNKATRDAFVNSLVLAISGTLVTLIAAIVVAMYVVGRQNWFSRTLDLLAKGPAGLSHLVLAIAILQALSSPPFRLGGSLTILLIAFVVFFLPQAYVAAAAALGQLGGELGEASAISGAGRVRTFLKITFPLMMPGIAGAGIVLFVVMLGEVTGSALLSGSSAPVLGFQMLLLWNNGTFGTIAALGVVMALFSTCVALLLLRFGRTTMRR